MAQELETHLGWRVVSTNLGVTVAVVVEYVSEEPSSVLTIMLPEYSALGVNPFLVC